MIERLPILFLSAGQPDGLISAAASCDAAVPSRTEADSLFLAERNARPAPVPVGLQNSLSQPTTPRTLRSSSPLPARVFSERAEASLFNLVELTQSGFFYCLACERIVEPLHSGEHNQCCPLCQQRSVEWLPPVFFSEEAAA